MLRDGNGSEVEYEAFLAEDVAEGLEEEWKRPMHWAGFLVVGASTRLPSPEGVGRGVASGVVAEAESVASKPFEKWDVNEVSGLFKAMGFAEAADAIKENGIDGKYFAEMLRNSDEDLTTSIAEGGLGFKRLQLKVVKAKIEESQAVSKDRNK
jgi:hypothetical protein